MAISTPGAPNRSRVSAPLDVDMIVRAARTVVDRDGLSKLTMRRLGTELDVEAMSIYHHIADKAELLRLVAQSTLAPLDRLDSTSSPSDSLAEFCRLLRGVLLSSPELAPLVVGESAPSLLSSAPARSIDQALQTRGFDADAASWIVESFVGFVAGHSLVELSSDSSDAGDAAFETGLRFMLAGLRDELGE